jgi:hypothetical protein
VTFYLKLYVVFPPQALINCEVTALEENLVSWFLVTTTSSSSPTFSLLTVGFQTYSSDTR